MAIAFVNAADLGDSGSSSSLTASYTAGSGANRLLIVAIITSGGPDDIIGVTYAGTSMTQIAKLAASGNILGNGYLYYLLNPTSGANNVVASFSASHAHIIGGAADYTGVAQSGQPDASTTNTTAASASVTSLTTTLTTVANNCWTILVSFQNSGVNPTAGTGSTKRTNDATFAALYCLFDSNGAITPAGSTSMTISLSSAASTETIMASFAPAVAASTVVFRRTLSRLGTRVGSRQMVA